MSEAALNEVSCVIINNLAIIYIRQSKYIESKMLLELVVEYRKNSLGLGHSNTLFCMNNLANVLNELGELEEAEGLYQV